MRPCMRPLTACCPLRSCVIRGCVPKKLMVFCSQFSDEIRDSRGFGWTVGEVGHSWAEMVASKDKEISRLNCVYAGILKSAGVTYIGETSVQCRARALSLCSRPSN